MTTELTYKGKNKLLNNLKNRKFYHNKKYMGSIIGFVVVLIVLSGVAYLYPEDVNRFANDVASGLGIKDNSVARTGSSQGSNTGGVIEAVTIESFPSYLENTDFARDLPRNARINLFIDDNAYMLSKSSVEEGSFDDPEIIIRMPERYLPDISVNGFCETISTAWHNRDVEVETTISNVQLALKYRGMMQHRSCITG